MHNYDQVAVARSLERPILILQGDKDFQVSPENDFAVWKQALVDRSNVTFHLYPELSHFLTPAGDTLTTADYDKTGHVDPAVIDDIANWIKTQTDPHRLKTSLR